MVGKVNTNGRDSYRIGQGGTRQSLILKNDKYLMENYVYARVGDLTCHLLSQVKGGDFTAESKRTIRVLVIEVFGELDYSPR